MKKQKVKLNTKLPFEKDVVSTLNKDGMSKIVGGGIPTSIDIVSWVCK